MKNNIVVIAIIVAVVFGAAGFFGGMKYQQSKRMQFAGGGPGRLGGQNGQTTNRGGFRPVTGEISTSDDTSITVRLQDGSSKIVLLTDKTMINKSSQGSKTDLSTGAQVSVFGTENTDGSVTAQNVQLGTFVR